jgi:phosphate:Na+ symporter
VSDAAEALRQAQQFISDVSGPPESEEQQKRLTSTLHALDHASRLAKAAREEGEFQAGTSGSDEARAAELCSDAMRDATTIADKFAEPTPAADGAPPAEEKRERCASTEEALVQLERHAKSLGEMLHSHPSSTLGAVATGALTTQEAITRVESVRRLEALAHHAWRAAAQFSQG